MLFLVVQLFFISFTSEDTMAAKKVAKKPHVNQPFKEDIRDEAYRLIRAGAHHPGGFWRNRTVTVSANGYPDGWMTVPIDVQKCINQIGRGAQKQSLKKKRIEQSRHPLTPAQAWEEELMSSPSMQHGLHPEDERDLFEYFQKASA